MNNSDSIKQMVENHHRRRVKLLISSIGLDFIGGRRYRRDEHHAGVRNRAHQRNRRAHGNRRTSQQYLQQFLIEAVLICIIGGLSGVLLSASISLVFNYFVTDFPMSISMASVIGAVVCSTAIGVAFGFMPANKASKLNPIDALAQD